MATLIDSAVLDHQPTRAELIEAIQHHNATLRRMPAHWTERRAGLHAKVNDLLDQLEAMDRGQATAPHA